MADQFRPDKCPRCESNRVGKERIMGQQTGDWYCGECKLVFTRYDIEKGKIPPKD